MPGPNGGDQPGGHSSAQGVPLPPRYSAEVAGASSNSEHWDLHIEMTTKTKEQWQAEKVEILEHNLAILYERPNKALFADDIASYEHQLTETKAGNFYTPNTYQDEEAHTFALKLARKNT